jgi:hypothetical protein
MCDASGSSGTAIFHLPGQVDILPEAREREAWSPLTIVIYFLVGNIVTLNLIDPIGCRQDPQAYLEKAHKGGKVGSL